MKFSAYILCAIFSLITPIFSVVAADLTKSEEFSKRLLTHADKDSLRPKLIDAYLRMYKPLSYAVKVNGSYKFLTTEDSAEKKIILEAQFTEQADRYLPKEIETSHQYHAYMISQHNKEVAIISYYFSADNVMEIDEFIFWDEVDAITAHNLINQMLTELAPASEQQRLALRHANSYYLNMFAKAGFVPDQNQRAQDNDPTQYLVLTRKKPVSL